MYCTAEKGRGALIAGSERLLYVGTGPLAQWAKRGRQVKEVSASLGKLPLDKWTALPIMEARYINVYILYSLPLDPSYV
jgi:hypothetical protein